MAEKRRNIIFRVAGSLLPALAGIFIVLCLFVGYTVWLVTHPKRTKEEITPEQYSTLTAANLGWSEERWTNKDGTTAIGWFLRSKPGAPGIILYHSYGRNRSELLDLGARLQEVGYHVLLPDLRGHGISPVQWTSLGQYETEDVLSAISFLKGAKNGNVSLVDPMRIGLYGISLGGYAALSAAHQDASIQTVIVDGVYRHPNVLTRSLMGEMFANAGTELDGALDFGLKVYFLGSYHTRSIEEAAGKLAIQRVLFISATNAGVFDRSTRELFSMAMGQKELLTFDYSRVVRLEGAQQAAYDDRIVGLFRRAMPREGEPRLNAERAAVTAR